MKRFKYSLLCSAMALSSLTATAAEYEVIEVGNAATARHSYATGINANGDVVGIYTDHFNYPINFDTLDMDAVEADLALRKEANPDTYTNVDIANIRNRDLNADALDYLIGYLSLQTQNVNFQQIRNQSAFAFKNDTKGELTVFDEVDANLGSKTRNTVDLANAINDNGVAVASGTDQFYYADYTPLPTETEPDPETIQIWQRDFLKDRAVVTDGTTKTELMSPDTQFGGLSFVTDISNNNYVVGYAATGLSATAQANVDSSCADITEPTVLQRCGVTQYSALIVSGLPFFVERAYLWKLNDNLEIEDEQELGMLFSPAAGDERTHITQATGVNIHGNAVGFSDGFRNASDSSKTNVVTREIAVYWKKGEPVKQFIDQTKDQDEDSRALDINDDNWVVGYTENYINLDRKKQMFVYDANSDVVTYPNVFFSSGVSVGHAINNAKMVVGTAEVENSVGTTRRQRGFIHNIDTGESKNLNDLIACNSPYTIAEARDINDQGMIAATAIINVDKLDSMGNVILDSNGAPVKEEVARAVKLMPIAGGSQEDCSAIEPVTYERKGAGLGWLSLLLLGSIMTIRRLVR